MTADDPEIEGIVLAQLPTLTIDSVHSARPWSPDDTALAHHGLRTLVNDLDLHCPTLMAESPGWWPLLKMASEHSDFPIVYDCMDDHSGWNIETAQMMLDYETRLAEQADLVLASALPIQQRLERVSQPLLVPNGCDANLFATASEANNVLAGVLPRPIIGYYGALSSGWFDTALLCALAARRPDWSFVTIGPTDTEVAEALDALPNVLQLGTVEYKDLPRYAADFDVAIIPFLVNDLTRATDPVKLYEFFAADKPVVATPMPELYQYQGLLSIAATPDEFESAITDFLENPGNSSERVRIGFEASWDHRIDLFEPAIAEASPSLDIVVLAFNNCALTRACLESIFADESWPARVFVVDNASTDDTADLLSEIDKRPDVVVIRNPENVGFAVGNNVGIEAGKGDYVLILNNDTIVPPGTRSAFVHALAADPNIGLVGPVTNSIGNEAKIYIPYDEPTPAAIGEFADELRSSRRGMMFDIPVAALFAAAFRRSDFVTIGGIPDHYQIGMFEDDDFAERFRRLGRRVVCDEAIFVHHSGGAAFSSLDPVVYRAIFDRNRRVFERETGRAWVPHTYRSDQSAPAAT